MKLDLSVVVPLLNEAENLEELYRRVRHTLEATGESFELVFVDDGSNDNSIDVLRRLREQDGRVRIVSLARNYGQHHAIMAGLRCAAGRVVITMDADLQSPPEAIPQLIAPLRSGAEIVFGVPRSRADSRFSRLTSVWAHHLMRSAFALPRHVRFAPFRALDRALVDRVVGAWTSPVQLESLIQHGTNRMATVEIEHAPRRSGRTKYGVRGRILFGLNLLTAVAPFPFRLTMVVGALCFLFGLSVAVLVAFSILSHSTALILAFMLTLNGALMSALGLVGECVAEVRSHAAGRPQYLIRECANSGIRPLRFSSDKKPRVTYLRGDRVRIRPLDSADLNTCLEWVNDAELMRAVNRRQPVTRREHRRWYARTCVDPSQLLMAIEASDEERYIGNCGFRSIDTQARKAEGWIYIGDREFHGRGLGSEAFRLLLQCGFNQLNLHRIYLYVADYNAPALALYRNLGFMVEGIDREAIFSDGRYHDAIRMGFLRSEWRNNGAAKSRQIAAVVV